MDHVHGRTVIRGLSREENGSAIRGPIRPREELVKRRGELPRRASDAIEDVELATVIEFAYEGDRAGIRRPGGQTTRRGGVGLDQTSRREVGEVKAVRVLGPSGPLSDEENVARASEVV